MIIPIPNITENPPAKQKISTDEGKPLTDVSKYLMKMTIVLVFQMQIRQMLMETN